MESEEHYQFSPREMNRLAAYRQAVLAGFYNDQCEDVYDWSIPSDTAPTQPVKFPLDPVMAEYSYTDWG